MNDRKVDVLSFMAYASAAMACAPEVPGYNGSLFAIDENVKEKIENEISAARAAVAELIEAASRAAIAACRGDDFHPGTIRNADLDALRAALANVGGAE